MRGSGADLILFNIVNAFKFPDNAQVFLTCNVEVKYNYLFLPKAEFSQNPS